MPRTGEATWTLGDVRVTRILESEATLAPQDLLPDLDAAMLARHERWLKPHFVDAQGRIRMAIQGFVVESCGRTILVDTCIGMHAVPGFEMLGEGSDTFLRELEAAGFSRDGIDCVLCTHMHFDHVGWNTMREGDRHVPTFPRARYLFARAEYAHWRDAPQRSFAATFDACVTPVIEAGLADLVETDHRITDEVWLEATPGHTPGHVAVRIASQGVEALVTGDLTHHPVQWAEPDLPMPADSDPAQAAATRRRLLARHADGPLLVIGTHYAAPCSGRLVREAGGGHRFEAAAR